MQSGSSLLIPLKLFCINSLLTPVFFFTLKDNKPNKKRTVLPRNQKAQRTSCPVRKDSTVVENLLTLQIINTQGFKNVSLQKNSIQILLFYF